MIAIMICLHRNGWQCQIRTSRTRFQTHCEAPFFALGLHAEGSPSGISFGRCDHSKDLVLMYANMQTFCVTPRDIWRRTMLMRRTIYWEPCLAPERCGSFKSTWTCPSGNLQHSWDRQRQRQSHVHQKMFNIDALHCQQRENSCEINFIFAVRALVWGSKMDTEWLLEWARILSAGKSCTTDTDNFDKVLMLMLLMLRMLMPMVVSDT